MGKRLLGYSTTGAALCTAVSVYNTRDEMNFNPVYTWHLPPPCLMLGHSLLYVVPSVKIERKKKTQIFQL